jgi:hypothetical protein
MAVVIEPRTDFRTQKVESDFTRAMRERKEASTMLVRCRVPGCRWKYKGKALTGVIKAREHREQRHPDLPVVSPVRPLLGELCKIDGCSERRVKGGGRYGGLCLIHRAEGEQAVREERARVLAARAAAQAKPKRAPKAPKPKKPPRVPKGKRHTRYAASTCKLDGCDEPWAVSKGKFAYLCAGHADVRRARPAPRTASHTRVRGMNDAQRALVLQLYGAGIPDTGIVGVCISHGWWGGTKHAQVTVSGYLRAQGLPARRPYRVPDLNATEVDALFQQYAAEHEHTG